MSRAASAPERDTPDQPTDLPKEAFPAIVKRTFKQFGEDQLTTWAAALTYFGVLSLFPMLLALVSVLGVIGPSATQPLLDNLSSVAPGPAKDILTNVLTNLEQNQGGSLVALIIGLAVAIWSASGYIGAFMDASNNVWDVPEGRPIWKKIPVRLAVTVGLLAVVLWIAASALFALYVANFSSYNKTYGSLGGVIVFLTWLWITNIIILLGAEFNSEMERSKAIQEGHPPDKEPFLPLRDDSKLKD